MILIKSARTRCILRYALPLAAIPAVVALAALLLPGKWHMLASLAVAALSLLLFLAGFERRRTGQRRLVAVAVMVALCIVGRFIPFFKPITALTVLSAMYFGAEAGFLTGALSALLSNFYFGQGPWTPFQMLAWGLIGLMAGFLADPLKKRRWLLMLYGVGAGIAYSLVMDVWTVMWYAGSFDPALYLTAFAAAAPHTLLYALSNLLFLLFLARPLGRKLARVCLRYGV